MRQKINTSRQVSTAFEIRLLRALDKAGADDCGEWLLVHPDDLPGVLTEEITNLAWAFNASFLAGVTGIEIEAFEAIHSNKRCEANNEAMIAVIQGTCGVERFVDAAVQADGAGHFLASYDSEEIEVPVTTGRSRKLWTAYRTN